MGQEQKQLRNEIRKAKKQKWHFNIVSGNGLIVATSEMYKTQEAAVKTANRIADCEIEVADV